MGTVRYLVGAEAALSELLVRTDWIINKLTTLEESMASIEERAGAVVDYLDADRKALVTELALVTAERDVAAKDRDQFKLALEIDAGEESTLGDKLAPFEAEMVPPTPEPEPEPEPTPDPEPTPEPTPEA